MVELNPNSLSDYIDQVEGLHKRIKGPLWFRGCSQSSHALLPSLYRKRQREIGPSDLAQLEDLIFSRFRERSIPYHIRPLTDDFESLFIMQHYGVPTRLLDWSENPLAGLFFAVRNAAFKITNTGKQSFTNPAIVWVLDPSKWNKFAIGHVSFTGGILYANHERVKAYKPIGKINELAPRPIALYGAHNSSRIVAQQGAFVLFGSDIKAMETYTSQQDLKNCLTKIIIKPKVIGKIRESLLRHGLTDSALFPDLEGLSRDLRRQFGFEH